MSPLLRAAAAAAEGGLQTECHPWSIVPGDFFEPAERTRENLALLIGASGEDVALTPSASFGISTAAANLPLEAGQNIVMLAEQYPSNVYAWQALAAERGGTIKTVPRPADGDWTAAVLETVDSATAIAALPHNHWHDGGLLDLERIGEALRAQGTALAVDASQSLGALPLDVRRVQPDFLASCGYKWLLCPYGFSFLYVAPKWQQGRPLDESWHARAGAEDFARLAEYSDDYMAGARRFDQGERARFIQLPAATVALKQLNAWGVENIQATLGGINARIAEAARELGLRTLPEDRRAGHFLGLIFPEGVPEDLPEKLKAQRIYVSVRGKSVRVTPHLWVDDEDVIRFVTVLKAAL
ncbi:MAG: aminotransferase class V-fold PLP-dependent enzyme, partial [Rhodovibrionaceae bacterium]